MKPEVEQVKRLSSEELFSNSLTSFQKKVLKPLLKREKQLKDYLELLEKYTWEIQLPAEVEEVYSNNGHSLYPTETYFREELNAAQEMIRRIEGKPKHYDNRPDQQLYYEIEEAISDIIKREVGRHSLGDYNETYYEVRKRVAKRISNYNPQGFEYSLQDVSDWIVKYINEVKNEYPEFYKE